MNNIKLTNIKLIGNMCVSTLYIPSQDVILVTNNFFLDIQEGHAYMWTQCILFFPLFS